MVGVSCVTTAKGELSDELVELTLFGGQILPTGDGSNRLYSGAVCQWTRRARLHQRQAPATGTSDKHLRLLTM